MRVRSSAIPRLRDAAARCAAASSGADRVHPLQWHSPRRFFDRVQEHVVGASDLVRKHHDQEPDDSHDRRQRRRHRHRLVQARDDHRRLRYLHRRRLHLAQERPRHRGVSPCSRRPKTCISRTAPLPTRSSRASASAARPPAASATCGSRTASSPRAKTYAIYIKSRPGRGAFIENIFADGLEVSNCTGGFLRLNMANSGIQDQDPVPGDEGIPTARNWRFSNVVVHDVPKLVQATELDPRKPLDESVADQHHRHLQGGNLPGARAARCPTGHPGHGLHRSTAQYDRRDRQRIGGCKALSGARKPRPMSRPRATPYKLH